MKRLFSTLRWDITLQMRNGFYYAVGFVLLVWAAIYTQFTQVNFRGVLPGILLANLEITTFYFLAGIIMLEKSEGTLEAGVVTPLRSGEYLGAKVLSVSLLALAENLLVTALYARLQFAALPVALGGGFGGAMFALCGFLTVVRYRTINEFLLPSMLYITALTLPLLDFFGVVRSHLFYLHPLQAPLMLLRAGFGPLAAWQWAYGILYSLLWIALFGWAARRAYRQFVAAGAGGK
jgi:fluoroquinolone transport system permease protein